MRARTLIWTGVAVLLTLTASACGSSKNRDIASRTPDAIVQASTQAIDGAHSVRVTGTIPDGSSADPIRIDIALVNDRGATGSLSENGVSFRLITVGSTSYINGSPAFWRQFAGAGAAAQLDGRWLRAPAGSGKLSSLEALTDAHRLLTALLAGHGALTKGAQSTLSGHRVIALHDASRNGTLYVATTGPAYPIRIADTGSEGGELNFGDFDAAVTIAAPSHSIAISSLTR